MPTVIAFSRRVHIVCGEYHKYWLMPGTRRNPLADDNTRRMMDLKEFDGTGKPTPKQARSLHYFGTALANFLATQVSAATPIQIAIVPPHGINTLPAGLDFIVRKHCSAFTVTNTCNLLRRHTPVAKRAAGGERFIESTLKSVEVISSLLDPDASATILLDDIVTTGSSLAACAHLLERAGAPNIISIALLQTAHHVVPDAPMKVADKQSALPLELLCDRSKSLRARAHAIVDELPSDATWRDLVDMIIARMSLEHALGSLGDESEESKDSSTKPPE